MKRTQFELKMDELGRELDTSQLFMESIRDGIWERVLGNAPSERRICPQCKGTFFPHRKDQRFCPGGRCSNTYHSQQHRDKYIS